MRYALLIILCALLLALSQGSANAPEPRAVLSWDPDEIIENLDTAPGDTVFLYVKLLDVPDIESISFETAWTPWNYPRGCYRMITCPSSEHYGWNEGSDTYEAGTEVSGTRTLHFVDPPRDGSCIRLAFTAQGIRDDLRATFCLRGFKITDTSGKEIFLLTPNIATISGGVDYRIPQYVNCIEPTDVGAGSEIDLRIHGGHFSSPLEAFLSRLDSPRTIDLPISTISESVISCRQVFAEADTGRWIVTVRNGDGAESMSSTSLHVCATVTPFPDGFADLSREVVVEFWDEMLQLPKGETWAYLEDTSIGDAEITSVLRGSGVLMVRKAFPDFDAKSEYITSRKGLSVRRTDVSEVYVLTVESPASVLGLVDALTGLPGVSYAEPNDFVIKRHFEPNDDYFSLQWSLYNTGQTGGATDADVDATEAWELSKGVAGVTIGIIDNGIQFDHIDFGNKVGGEPDTLTWPELGHGTKVAGIAAAVGNNDEGIAGVDWYARIHSVVTTNGVIAIFEAVHRAIDAGCDVVNMSWGDDEAPMTSYTVRFALHDAYRANIHCVASTGDEYSIDPRYPAGYDDVVMAVSGVDEFDYPWHEGPGEGTNFGPHVDVAAPAANMWTTAPGSQYSQETGTSYAAPVVTGIASLLLSLNSELDNDDIRRIIELSAEDTNEWLLPGRDDLIGHGRVNADSALQRLLPPWELSHFEVHGGIHDIQTIKVTFMDVSGLTDGKEYWAHRNEIRATVTLPTGFSQTPDFWARRVASVGYSNQNPCFGLPWSDIVSFNGSSITVRTFVYQVLDFLGRPVGWWPTEPANALMAYTVLGPLETVGVDLPGERPAGPLSLSCHPNPFTSSAEVSFGLAAAAHARVAVHDVAGRLVRILLDGPAESGINRIRWDGKMVSNMDAPAGVYFVTVESSGMRTSRKLTLAR
jgi:thermitase